MKLYELELETLRLLFADADGVPLNKESLELAKSDEQYAQYLRMLPGALNRAFSYMEARGCLPRRAVTVELGEEGHGWCCCAELPEDALQVREVQVGYGSIWWHARDWRVQEAGLYVLVEPSATRLRVSYVPRLPRVSEETESDWELPLPQTLAEWLPYYLKGELYLSDESDEAAVARQQFETFFSEYEALSSCQWAEPREPFLAGYWE